jgi:hypothetical protein
LSHDLSHQPKYNILELKVLGVTITREYTYDLMIYMWFTGINYYKRKIVTLFLRPLLLRPCGGHPIPNSTLSRTLWTELYIIRFYYYYRKDNYARISFWSVNNDVKRNIIENAFQLTVDFTKLWPQMFVVAKFASSLWIHKPICKQSPWLVPEVKEANQNCLVYKLVCESHIMNFWTSQRTSQRVRNICGQSFVKSTV